MNNSTSTRYIHVDRVVALLRRGEELDNKALEYADYGETIPESLAVLMDEVDSELDTLIPGWRNPGYWGED